jgi:predicted acetyltransferase
MPAASSPHVELFPPDERDRTAVTNLGVFYRYDLMPLIDDGVGSRVNAFGVIGEDDAAGHEKGTAGQEVCWSKPGILLPMLIRVDGEPAGFALVARPPHAHRSVDYRMEDFFVLNKWRRAGVGTLAVARVFERFPGWWEMGWLPRNTAAEAFWRAVTARWQPEEWVVSQAPGTPGLPGLRVAVGPGITAPG